MKIIKCFILFGFVLISNLFSSTSFRVMTYNALNFPSAEGSNRLPYFQTVFEAVSPDILIMQEIESEEGADLLLAKLNANGTIFSRANFIDGTDTDNMLYYKSSVASIVSQSVLSTSLRDISEYVMLINGNQIRFYSCHLKASDTSEDEQQRLAEITVLRNHLSNLNEGTEFIVVGDMNFYRSTESGYQKIIADEVNNIGRAKDLCTQVGNWHNNGTYSAVHTQSTRTGSLSDGGSSGGLDDRFDFIFSAYNLNDGYGIEYSSNSYTTYGNDGAHFNQSINAGINSAVSADIADALYYASDHLPVYADFISLDSGISPGDVIITEWMANPAALSDDSGEYVELYNTTSSQITMTNWHIKDDGTDDDTFSGTIGAHSLFVIGKSGDICSDPGTQAPDVVVSGLTLGNSGDEIIITDGSIEIARVNYSNGDPYGSGKSVELNNINDPVNGRLDYAADKYHASTSTWGGDNGSPGTMGGTLPVILSTFTAQYLNSKPTLYWQTQSEEDNMGWFIYRNTIEDFTSAEKITGMIEGNGTTTVPQSYIYEDAEELQVEQTYYYWLESVDYSGTIHHYDRVAQVTIPHPNDPGQNVTPPVAYDITADPNPFSQSTTISFALTQTGMVDCAIYNVKGELIKSYASIMATADEKVKFEWNGKNDAGKIFSNGVYLYSIKVNGKDYATRRMILMK